MSAALQLNAQARVSSVAAAASSLELADAEELERASLQRRFDRKFLLRAEHAAEVVAAVAGEYRVVLAHAERFALYDTVYFDTKALDCYHAHRRGLRPRYKLRVRNYVDRGLSMLEYKEKTPRGDTRKLRWPRGAPSAELSPEDRESLGCALPRIFDRGELMAQARTVFYRLTLLGARSVERATLDFNLSLERGSARRTVRDFVVVEVKDAGRGAASPMVSALRQYQARALPFSKYCVAIAVHGDERSNAFRPSLRALEESM